MQIFDLFCKLKDSYTMLRGKIDISFKNCIDARAKKKILAHHHFHHRYITSFECVEC